jgi:ParB-like nuclease domain
MCLLCSGIIDHLAFHKYYVHCIEVGGRNASGAGSKAWSTVLKYETLRIARIYVPVKRRGTVNADLVREIAESILDLGLQTPILVRADDDRYVLVEGLHRLEACKALGEETIAGFLVSAHASPDALTSSFETELEAVRRKTERLRQLRLAKEAAERPAASTAKNIDNRGSSDASQEKGRATRRSKTISLQEWLSERQIDGSSY